MGRIQRKKSSVKKKKKHLAASSHKNPQTAASSGVDAAGENSTGTERSKPVLPKKKVTIPAKAPAANQKSKDNFLSKSGQFLREVKAELKKVTWPSKKQTIGSTIVVIVLVLIISAVLGLVDAGLSGLIRVVIQ